jgi:hypothetical protein
MRKARHILNTPVFCNVMACQLLNIEVSEKLGASIFIIRGAPGNVCITLFRNVFKIVPVVLSQTIWTSSLPLDFL